MRGAAIGTRPRRLLLASASPRRRALLRSAGIPFRAIATGVSENVDEPCPPEHAATVVAERKAAAARVRIRAGEWVLAADTSVVVAGARLGKPENSAIARRMLVALAGREHRVLTGVTLSTPQLTRSGVASTTVRIRRLSEAEVDGYVHTGEWSDVAGGYRIQGRGAMLVEHLTGSYSNVVGLPLELLYGMLAEAGWHLWAPEPGA